MQARPSDPVRAMRIAHVVLQLETGGLERLLVEFARCADRARTAPQVVCMGRRGSLAAEIERFGVPVTALDLPSGLRPGAILRLASHFRRERIDVVHTHNTKPLLYAGPAARLAGVGAVVHTRHGQRHGSTARQNTLFRLAARCAERIVCVSEDSLRCSLREGLRGERLTTIPNGIDCERFQPAPDGYDVTGPPTLLFVGRLTKEKDLGTLLEAFAQLSPAHPSVRLRIVGDGPCRDELVALAGSLALNERVEFLGARNDVPHLYREASIVVLSSRTEGTPLTVLEAMASGAPVVATDVGGVAEAVCDGVTGTLVPAGEPTRIAAAIDELLRDPKRARAMGAAGCARCRERFDVRTMVAMYETLYERCLLERGRWKEARPAAA